MPLTYLEAKKLLSQYQGRGGKCPTNDEIDLFIQEVLQYLLFTGQHGSLRKFVFNAIKGCFTVPYELEVPLKVKIDGEVARSWDKWFEWHNTKDLDEGCMPADKALFEDPNYYPTVYDLPANGSRVGVIGVCSEDCDAHVIVQGFHTNGREVFTTHKGAQIKGEYLSVKKGELRYTATHFAKITDVLKTKTHGYVQLLWVQPSDTVNATGFLADYSPTEEKPAYRRYRITSPHCANSVQISVLGKIRLKAAYADNDYIPFDNIVTLKMAGQYINAQYNSDTQTAAAKDQAVQEMVARENEYKRINNGQPVAFELLTSAGAIKNII